MLSPLLGRFLSPDSIVPRPGDPQSLNRYSYVRNSPLSRIDPSGHVDDCEGISCQVGALIRVLMTPAYRPKDWKGFDTSSLDVTQELVKMIKTQACDTCTQVVQTRNALNRSWDGGMAKFISLVRATGMFDFKPEFQEKLINTVTIGGKQRGMDDVGNIFFGFFASQVGIGDIIQQAGAGAFQLYDNLARHWNPSAIGGLSTFFDQQEDNAMIRFGQSLYDKYSKHLDDLTPDVFNDEFDKFLAGEQEREQELRELQKMSLSPLL